MNKIDTTTPTKGELKIKSALNTQTQSQSTPSGKTLIDHAAASTTKKGNKLDLIKQNSKSSTRGGSAASDAKRKKPLDPKKNQTVDIMKKLLIQNLNFEGVKSSMIPDI